MKTMSVPTRTLDVRDLTCPLPILKARKALETMADGEILDVLADDPAAPLDFQVFCHRGGHGLVMSQGLDGVFSFKIEKGAAPTPSTEASPAG